MHDFNAARTAHISVVTSDPALLMRATELADGFALRGLDAVHLANAERLRQGVSTLEFVAFDAALNRAARLPGLALPDFIPR
ncbi:hypothetical protein GALL_517260 [mine drainage metagenome]|uniref:PIN domain-containing protein n=1 Tax=mine drainage metagenome TaxID=410659 RepID=A0A1J5P670_9ZZZZ